MPVANLRLRVTSRWTGDADGAARQLTGSVGNAAGVLRRVGGMIGRVGRIFGRPTMLKGMIALAPAMFTLGKAALALAGGALALGVVVTAAVAPWVGLAVTAAKNADKMGPAGQRFTQGAKGVGAAWMNLAKATAPQTLGPLTAVLDGVVAAIPKLEPLVRDVAPAFAGMGKDIGNWLTSGNGLGRFLDNIRDYGVPAFKNLVAAGKDALAVVGEGFRAFSPMARDISDGLREGAAKLRDWGKGGGFRRFLDAVKSEWPTVKESLKQINRFMGKVGGVLNSAGTGGLGALSTVLDLMNSIDPKVLTGILVGYASGKLLVGLGTLLAGLAAFRAARGQIVGAVELVGSAGLLSGAGLSLFAMADSIRAMARRIRERAVQGVRNAASGGKIGRIKEIWKNTPKNVTATANVNGLTASVVAAMGISSTWATVQTNFASPASFRARLDQGGFLLGRTQIIFAWAGVKIQAQDVPNFTASATAGNVTGVANQIVSAWQRAKSAAASPGRFTASGNVGNVVSGSSSIINAWRRVTSMPKTWSGSARASAGNVPGASSAIVSSWRQLYGQARTWSGVATCSFSGGFGGLGGGGGGGGGGGYQPNIPLGIGFVKDKLSRFALPGGPSWIIDVFEPEFDKNTNGVNDAPWGDLGIPQFDDDVEDFIGDAYDKVSDWFGFAEGGSPGYTPSGSYSSGRGGTARRQVHIRDDIRVRNVEELTAVIGKALGG